LRRESCGASGFETVGRKRWTPLRETIDKAAEKKIGGIGGFAIHFPCQAGRDAQNAVRFCATTIDAKGGGAFTAEGNLGKSGSSRTGLVMSDVSIRRLLDRISPPRQPALILTNRAASLSVTRAHPIAVDQRPNSRMRGRIR
jgi:hypothetical protein